MTWNSVQQNYVDGKTVINAEFLNTLQNKVSESVSIKDFGADPTGVSDSTTALINAISAAKAAGINAVNCSGGKFKIDTGGITLTNITLFANSPPDFGNTYGDTGGTFLLTSTTTSPFTLGQGWAIKGITFQYPAQDGDDAVPLVFPPLFIGTYVAGGVMEDVTVLNAYQIFKFNVGTAIGDFRLDRCRMYAVDRVFWFLEGAPEVINITDCIFSPGMYVPALTPNTYLRNYTATSGEFMRIDVGGGANTSVDGLNISSTIVYGYRYGVRVVSGQLNVSSVHDCWFDAVSTALSIEGTATIANTRISDNYFWSSNLSDASTSYATIALSAASASNLKVTGNDFVYSQGDHISWNAASTNDIHILGNRFKNWGKENTAPAASYYAINATDSNLNGSIVSNKFQPSSGTIAHNRNGIGIGNCTDLAVLSNEFDDCYLSLWTVAGTKYKVIGNVSKSSGFTTAFLNACAAGVVESASNRWDKAPSGPSGIPSFTIRAGTQTFTGAKTQVVFATESIDRDANVASDTFTAPTTDDYGFYVQLNNTTGLTVGDVWSISIEQAGSGSTLIQNTNRVAADVAGAVPLICSGIFSLVAGDTVKIYITRVSGTGNYVSLNSANHNVFTGYRIS